MYEVICGMSLRCFDRLSNRKGARFSLLGQAKRAELERDKLRDRGGRGAGAAGARGRDLLDGHKKKEARGVEPRASDDYYCSAGLSVSIGQ